MNLSNKLVLIAFICVSVSACGGKSNSPDASPEAGSKDSSLVEHYAPTPGCYCDEAKLEESYLSCVSVDQAKFTQWLRGLKRGHSDFFCEYLDLNSLRKRVHLNDEQIRCLKVKSCEIGDEL